MWQAFVVFRLQPLLHLSMVTVSHLPRMNGSSPCSFHVLHPPCTSGTARNGQDSQSHWPQLLVQEWARDPSQPLQSTKYSSRPLVWASWEVGSFFLLDSVFWSGCKPATYRDCCMDSNNWAISKREGRKMNLGILPETFKEYEPIYNCFFLILLENLVLILKWGLLIMLWVIHLIPLIFYFHCIKLVCKLYPTGKLTLYFPPVVNSGIKQLRGRC